MREEEIHLHIITALNYFEYFEDINISLPENYLAAMCDRTDSVHGTSNGNVSLYNDIFCSIPLPDFAEKTAASFFFIEREEFYLMPLNFC